MRRLLCLAGIAALVAGCDTPNTRFASLEFGDAKGLAAGGNLRLITQRPREMAAGRNGPAYSQNVMCSEPSPDYLVTFDRKVTGKAQGNFVADAAATIDTNIEFNENAGQNGAGRTAGVLALRDGLYAACQAYANGIIGQDAYSAILSQYGFLITTVAVSEGKSAASMASPTSSAFAAVLVACLSGHDPSRPTPGNGNPILDRATCREIIRNAGRGRHG